MSAQVIEWAAEHDLLVRGGTLVTEEAAFRGDVAVQGGRISAILPAGADAPARLSVDATGWHVLPGVVDCHVHLNEPGRTEWEGYRTGTAAAAAGGITTVLDMPLNCHPPTLTRAALAHKRAAVAEQAIVDYGHWGGYVGTNLADLDDLFADGVVGCKAFLSASGLAEFPPVDDAALLAGMRRVAALGSLLALHAENDRLTTYLGEQEQRAGARDPRAWARSRPPFTEVEAVQRALLLAREAGARVHFVHLSTPEAATLVGQARASGLPVSGETCPHYLALDEGDLDRLGPVAKCAPPLRPRALVDALWDAVLRGDLDCVASDHSPCPPANKRLDEGDVWAAWGGIAGVQTLLPVLLDEGVRRRGVPLRTLVRLTSTNPAHRFGLYPRKGTLRVGSDADLALVDLDRAWTLREDDLLTRWPLSPFVGRTFRGRVEMTVVRGTVVFSGGRICVGPGYGELVQPERLLGGAC